MTAGGKPEDGRARKNWPKRNTLRHNGLTVILRKAANRVVICGLLRCKRLPFTRPKVTFRKHENMTFCIIIFTKAYKKCDFLISLHKISCARQFKNKLSLLSLALSLHKISCARQFKNKLSLLSLALSLHKQTSCIHETDNRQSVKNSRIMQKS